MNVTYNLSLLRRYRLFNVILIDQVIVECLFALLPKLNTLLPVQDLATRILQAYVLACHEVLDNSLDFLAL